MDEYRYSVTESSADCVSSIPSFPACQNPERSTRQIWIHVPFERVDKATGKSKPLLEVVIEKKSMINLVSRVRCN